MAALAAGWVFLAPTQLGGSVVYTATTGDSMEPLFHKGDLAMVRPAAVYRVGDIVLYRSPVLHRAVLHRILVIQNGHYFFKGDHNEFVDPGYATRGELLGKLWYRIPGAGRVLAWFGVPSHAALFAGTAMAFVLLAGGAGTTRRARKRAPVTKMRRRVLHRPRKSAENVVAGVTAVLGALCLLLGFTTPLKQPAPVEAYAQSGLFSYRSTAGHPSSAFPTGEARTGDPLFLNSFSLMTARFSYRFETKLPHSVAGTIALKAVLSSTTTLENTFVLASRRPFRGDSASVEGSIDLRKLKALMTQLAIDSGQTGASYDLRVIPIVQVAGSVAGKHVDATFSPALPFSLDQAVLKLNLSEPVAPPGATYAPPSAAQTLAAGLAPSARGTIPGFAPRYATFARYHFAISAVRGAGLGLAGLALIALLGKLFKPEREIWSNERRIAGRYGSVVIDVGSFGADHAAPGLVSEVPSFESLAILAAYRERPILREAHDGTSRYAVEDNGRLYIHAVAPSPQRVAPAEAGPPTHTPRAGRQQIVRGVALLVLLGVAVTLTTSFTATNSVPLSRVGRSVQARQLSQLLPSQCSGIAVTSLVVATSSTVTGTTGNDLILGRNASGTQYINGGGGTDCLVGGGGASTTNRFDGGNGTGDVCIGTTAATDIFTGCETHYN